MLNFKGFDNLIPYFKFAQENLNNKDIFFVGGIVRDILLDLKTDNFEDVDITLAGEPEKVFKNLNQDAGSIFKTDKFGTITIVKKDIRFDLRNNNIITDNKDEITDNNVLQVNSEKGIVNSKNKELSVINKDNLGGCNKKTLTTSFEITPFRTEGDYSDARHPDELNWSDSLLEDSVRRDFTMNCLYYTFQDFRIQAGFQDKINQKAKSKKQKGENLIDLHDLPDLTNGQKKLIAENGEVKNNTKCQDKNFSSDSLEQIHQTSSFKKERLSVKKNIIGTHLISSSDFTLNKGKDKFKKLLKKNGFIVLDTDFGNEYPILIIQDKKLIETTLTNGKLQKNEIRKLVGDIDFLHIIFDPQNGINDLLNQKIKAVGNPDDRIKEDALRIIRAIRFVSILNTYEHINLDFDPKTWLALKKYYFLIRKVAKERVIQEMKKVFKKGNAFGFVALMDELNILKYFFPALYNCKNNNQPTRYHPFDTYAHTILCLYHLQQINKNYLVRFAMLYHDVGKPDQYYWASIKKDETSQSELYKLEINHPIIGAELTENDFRNLGFSNKEVEEISFYVKYHMYPGELLFMGENKRKTEIKKFISKYGIERLLNLCDVTIGDRLGQYNPLQHSNIEGIVDLKNEINTIYEESGRITLKDLAVNGNDVIKIIGKAGPEVGKILNKLLELVLEGKVENEKEKLIQEIERLKEI